MPVSAAREVLIQKDGYIRCNQRYMYFPDETAIDRSEGKEMQVVLSTPTISLQF